VHDSKKPNTIMSQLSNISKDGSAKKSNLAASIGKTHKAIASKAGGKEMGNIFGLGKEEQYPHESKYPCLNL